MEISTRFSQTAFTALLLATLSGAAHSQSPESTINETLKQAIEKNPEVQASWHNFLASREQTRRAWADNDASVDVFADYSVQYQSNIPNEHFHGASAQISLTKMLYDGGRVSNQAESFQNDELTRYFELLDSVENTALEAYKAYQDVLRYRELARLAQINYLNHQEVYKKIEAGVETGATRRADLEQITGRLALAETNLLTEKANLHDVSARFLRIVGVVPARHLKPADISETILPSSFDEVMNYAYQYNPSFHAAIRNIEAKRSSVSAERSENKPRLDLTAEYGGQTYDQLGYNNEQTNAKVALEFRYNLYNGERTDAAIQQALEEVSRANYLRDKECIDMRQTLQISYNDVKQISQQLPILDRHKNASDRVRVAFKEQFNIGQRSLLDLLDTEIEFFQSSRAYANAHYERNISIATTLAEMGKLLENLKVVRSGLPSLSDLGAEEMEVDPATTCPIVEIPDMDYGIIDPNPVVPKKPVEFVAPAPENKEGNTYRLEILFAYYSADIDEDYNDDIANLARFMQENPQTVIEVRGHTSLEGSEKLNQRLSEQRAQAVVNALVQQGADPSRLVAIGFGETQPLINEISLDANRINRRIETNIKTVTE